MIKRFGKIIVLVFVLFTSFVMIACGSVEEEPKEIKSPMVSLRREKRSEVDYDKLIDRINLKSYYSFASNLYPEYNKKKPNLLLSPLSAYLAFGMLYNGANGASAEELERLFGSSLDNVNNYSAELYAYYNEVYKGMISTSNSIWVNDSRDDYTLKDSFKDAGRLYYDAEMFSSPFDETTVSDINNWVYNKTDGMIKKTIDDISKDAILFLINTVLFDGKWNELLTDYEKYDFTNLDGSIKNVDMITGKSSEYYENDEAQGFMRTYSSASGNYAFFGILPKDYENFYSDLMSNIYDLYISMPKYNVIANYRFPAFEYDYEFDIKETLMKKGFTNIFDDREADFTNMFDFIEGNVCVDTAFQKARIECNKEGTKAAAVTVIGMVKTTAVNTTEYTYVDVFLDRPFIYCIFDLTNRIPVFVGTITTL